MAWAARPRSHDRPGRVWGLGEEGKTREGPREQPHLPDNVFMAGRWIEPEAMLEMTADELRRHLQPQIEELLASNPDRRELQAGLISLREVAVRVITRKNRLEAWLAEQKDRPTHKADQIAHYEKRLGRMGTMIEELKEIMVEFETRVRDLSREARLLEFPEANRRAARQIILEQEEWIRTNGGRRPPRKAGDMDGAMLIIEEHIAKAAAEGQVAIVQILRTRLNELRSMEAELLRQGDQPQSDLDEVEADFNRRLDALRH